MAKTIRTVSRMDFLAIGWRWQVRTRRIDHALCNGNERRLNANQGELPVVRAFVGGLCAVAVTVMLNVSSGIAAGEPEPTRELGRDPLATYPVFVEIGESGYVIPRNYIQSIWRLAPDRPLQRVVLRVLWPGLEPLTAENQYLWERRHPEKQIKMSIVRRSRDGYHGLQSAIGRGVFDKAPAPFSYDLVKYQWNYYRRYLSTDDDYRTPSGTPLVFACNDTNSETKARFDFEPICQVDYRLSDGAGLHYTFFMVNLAQWREIDTAVRTLVDSLRR